MSPDAEGWIALGSIPGLGSHSFRKLLMAFGDPDAVLRAERGKLCSVVDSSLASKIVRGPERGKVDGALKWLEAPGHEIVTLADSDYPRSLLKIPDPPPFLYIEGRRELLGSKA
ncbi:MAG TPA: DNA-protecting protein DprA, partial [Burkholderiales bacterium]|nr:DNA-protecting protein DprA [Burkholderiales bacterium]